jgi:hypothetical protein
VEVDSASRNLNPAAAELNSVPTNPNPSAAGLDYVTTSLNPVMVWATTDFFLNSGCGSMEPL